MKPPCPRTYQPRKTFDKEKLKELSESIKKHGIIQPLVVRKKGLNYELVAGERRLRAAKLAKLQTVPVLVREYDEKQMRELSLVENIQRHDLNPLEIIPKRRLRNGWGEAGLRWRICCVC